MGLSNILILSQIAGYVIILILSLCIFIPIYLQVSDFNGHCLLFANGTWREDDGLFDVKWPSKVFCNFPMATGAFLFFFAIFQIYRFAHLAYNQKDTSFIGLFLDVAFGIVMLFLIVISAVFITVGFIFWCSAMTERFPSCEIAAGQNITKENEKVDTSRFYIEMGTAQISIILTRVLLLST
ncbi:transmembrane protein 179 isoform X2 [Condylostylus longicornis]|uniref:transmembrane protein 179 isoform X2 n=1 Tax=Condylostylus longicornis TaxID=2530218 RepID=UPI00244E3182|nr:transmembrane protein 179 isoform X2 [Condylostylus longicornis]